MELKLLSYLDLFFNDEVDMDEEAKEVISEEQVPEVLDCILQ